MVTGGAGFIGSHLVDALIEEKPSNLIVIDNLFLGKKKNLHNAFEKYPSLVLLEQDAADYDKMKAIIHKYKTEIIYNLAVIPLPASLIRPKWSIDQNISITTTLCELAKENDALTLIHFSSSEAYGTAKTVPMDENHRLFPLTPYAASKAADDYIVMAFRETFGIDTTIMRPFNTYGPRQNDSAYAGVIPVVINNVLNNRPIKIDGDGNQSRDFLYVQDTTRAAIEIYKSKKTRGRVINVASGKETSINELIKTILTIMDAGKHPILHGEPRPGDVRQHCGDITIARQLFGFQPTIGLLEGLKYTIDYYSSIKR